MAQRTIAFFQGKPIGIESIYTVINGRRINIQGKVEELREKSRNLELFCPCGCGRNLILVAGEVREQHFREKAGKSASLCKWEKQEGEQYVAARIVLKCWLDDKLRAEDVEFRMPIDTVGDTKRKIELSFLSRSRKIGVRYWNTNADITDEKLNVLANNASGIRVIHIANSDNDTLYGQYPEALIKIQKRQSYCILLETAGDEYDEAVMRAVFYAQRADGFWKEIVFAKGKMTEYSFDDDDNILFCGKRLDRLQKTAQQNFEEEREKRTARFAESLARRFTCKVCGKVAGEAEFVEYQRETGVCRECARKQRMEEPADFLVVPVKKEIPTVCPKCGGKLKKHRGKYGETFYGCCNFPKCNYTC